MRFEQNKSRIPPENWLMLRLEKTMKLLVIQEPNSCAIPNKLALDLVDKCSIFS